MKTKIVKWKCCLSKICKNSTSLKTSVKNFLVGCVVWLVQLAFSEWVGQWDTQTTKKRLCNTQYVPLCYQWPISGCVSTWWSCLWIVDGSQQWKHLCECLWWWASSCLWHQRADNLRYDSPSYTSVLDWAIKFQNNCMSISCMDYDDDNTVYIVFTIVHVSDWTA